MALTNILLKENWKNEKDFQELRQLVTDKVRDLYQAYLEYEMRSVSACYSPWVTGFKNLIKWNGWKGQLDNLISKEQEIENRSAIYNEARTVKDLGEVVGHLSSISTDLGAIRLNQER